MAKTKQIDIDRIIEFFGGKHQIVADYNYYLKKDLTIKAVEKWKERNSISIENVFNLQAIAKRKNKDFKLEEFLHERK